VQVQAPLLAMRWIKKMDVINNYKNALIKRSLEWLRFFVCEDVTEDELRLG
jgi:hypothetical protein